MPSPEVAKEDHGLVSAMGCHNVVAKAAEGREDPGQSSRASRVLKVEPEPLSSYSPLPFTVLT